jgi:hypothetical protein
MPGRTILNQFLIEERRSFAAGGKMDFAMPPIFAPIVVPVTRRLLERKRAASGK